MPAVGKNKDKDEGMGNMCLLPLPEVVYRNGFGENPARTSSAPEMPETEFAQPESAETWHETRVFERFPEFYDVRLSKFLKTVMLENKNLKKWLDRS